MNITEAKDTLRLAASMTNHDEVGQAIVMVLRELADRERFVDDLQHRLTGEVERRRAVHADLVRTIEDAHRVRRALDIAHQLARGVTV